MDWLLEFYLNDLHKLCNKGCLLAFGIRGIERQKWVMKSKRPRYIDGGLRWTDYAYLGQIYEHTQVKFGRTKNLVRLLKDISRKA